MSSSNELKRHLAGAQETGERVATLKALGATLLVEGNAADAGRAFGAAVALAPDDAEAVSGVRRALMASSRFAEALQWYRRELALAADDDVHRARLFKQMGDVFRDELKDLDNAQRAYTRARHLDPRAFADPEEPASSQSLPASSRPASQPTQQSKPTGAHPPAATPSREVPREPQAGTSRWKGRRRRVAVALAGALAGAITLGYGVHFAAPSLDRLAPPEASGPRCPEATTLAIVEQDSPAQRMVYQCAGSARTRRWTTVAGKRVELAMFVDGVPDGPVVLTPEPGLRIEGQYRGGVRSGTWLEFRDGVLVKLEEWSEGQSLTQTQTQTQTPTQTQTQTQTPTVDGDGDDGASDAGRADEGPGDATPGGPTVEELFAGMTTRSWRVRIAEIRAATQADPSRASLWKLTLHRARLAGLRVDDSGRMEEPSR